MKNSRVLSFPIDINYSVFNYEPVDYILPYLRLFGSFYYTALERDAQNKSNKVLLDLFPRLHFNSVRDHRFIPGFCYTSNIEHNQITLELGSSNNNF